LLLQVYKLLLSFEILGNPRGLFKRMATGVTDAFYEPLHGILRGPDEFAQGVLRGGKSLADNVLFGLSDTVGKISGSLGKGLAELSMDADYLATRASAAGNAGRTSASGSASSSMPRNVGEGFLQTVENVGGGLLRGVTGVVTKPLQGAQRGGVEGFFKGVAQGAVGLVVKPAVGVADGLGAMTEGIKNQTEMSLQQPTFAQRQRPPRALGFSGEVLPFDLSDAQGQALYEDVVASGFAMTKALQTDRYVKAVRLARGRDGVPRLLVVTTGHVAMLALSGGAGGTAQLEWSEPLGRVKACEEYAAEVGIHLRDGGLHLVPALAAASRREIIALLLRARSFCLGVTFS